MRKRQVKLMGSEWTLAFTRRMKDCYGYCNNRTKRIAIDQSTKGQKRLEILIHEMLHACGWHIDENFVKEAAKDMATILTELGYTADE
jgi:hypothetical protein